MTFQWTCFAFRASDTSSGTISWRVDAAVSWLLSKTWPREVACIGDSFRSNVGTPSLSSCPVFMPMVRSDTVAESSCRRFTPHGGGTGRLVACGEYSTFVPWSNP